MAIKDKCEICRFRKGRRCEHFGISIDTLIAECNIHLLYGNWDQTARTIKDKKKIDAERKLEKAKENK